MQIWSKSAHTVVDQLLLGKLSPSEVLDSLRNRVDEINPVLNALPTTCFARAYKFASRLEAKHANKRGCLAGLPIPIKDTYEVESVRSTWGSLAFADHVATRSNYLVQALEKNGGIVYAKSNTPEFEAGANTFNEVFGSTLNPWNTALSASGSSGGAAAAVASGMAFIAQGSDFACSLRYPAAFCGVVGLRPSPGIIPQGPSKLPHQVLSVIGPLARCVEDTALALDAMKGFDPRDPLSRPLADASYRKSAQAKVPAAKAAFSMDLGFATVSDEIQKVVQESVEKLALSGLSVTENAADFSAADGCFRTLRAYQFAATWRDTLASHRKDLKPEVVWNIEEGLKLTAREIAVAEASKAAIRRKMLLLLDENEFLITPTAPVAPFPVGERYVRKIGTRKLDTYLDWLALGYGITVTGCPVISIPCGFTGSGLPVAVQIVGKPYEEHRLLSFAASCESRLGARLDRPINPRGLK